ncbi:MAG TPA: DUF3820 family protein [Chitinophagaceae bacterium]|nr:DUF3820 family protein [Chitinophagaceae bacterium]
MKFNDDSPMPFGKQHKGKPLKDVPREYFIWMLDKGYLKGDLLQWAKENHPILNYGNKKGFENS